MTCRVRRSSPSFRLWRTSVTAGDLQHTVARYLGAERAERSFAEYAESRNAPLSAGSGGRHPSAALHRASAGQCHRGAHRRDWCFRCCCARGDAGSQSALRLLDDASEALQYNRDLLQSALDQVRHGLERIRQGHAADLLEPAVPRAAQLCRRSWVASVRRWIASCAPARSAATSAQATSTSSPPIGSCQVGTCRTRPSRSSSTAAVASSEIRTSPLPQGRHRHDLLGHHRAGRARPRRWRAPTRRWNGACGSAPPS